MTAESELSLNRKNRDATVDYYVADATAVKIISQLALAVLDGNPAEITVEGGEVVYNNETGVATFVIPIDMYRNLDISLSFMDDKGKMAINRYRVVSSLDWQKQRVQTITVLS